MHTLKRALLRMLRPCGLRRPAGGAGLLLVSLAAAAAAAFSPATAAAADRPLPGDPVNGRKLVRLHCAACHGEGALGDGPLARHITPAASDLRDASLLATSLDTDLAAIVLKGGKELGRSPAMPAFGRTLSALDVQDILAYCRRGSLVVSDFFPDTAKFLAKVYAIDADGQKRFENAVGEPLAPSEQKLAVITAFRGEMAPTGPELWPQDPVHLDQLLPRDRMGFVAFVPVMLGKEPVSVGIALDRELRIAGVAPATADAKMRDKLTAALKVFNGLGGRGTALKDPNDRSVKAPAELKKSMAKAYWRVREASTMFQKEERDRHWADPDAFSVEAGEDELKVKNKQ